MEARLEALEKEIKELKMGKPEKKEKKTRAPSAYNNFMKTELAKVKLAQPDMPHKERFKIAASNYTKKSTE
tara:strand:+ start:1378 stop:1590 length:213 start_codon:yes stop_codon:yes gene_type:complete